MRKLYVNFDLTYCGSECCDGSCGRQLTDEVRNAHRKADRLIKLTNYCKPKDSDDQRIQDRQCNADTR